MQITNAIKMKVTTHIGNVGMMEALAGLPADHDSRFRFWAECDREAKQRHAVEFATGDQVWDIARERCHTLTFTRIRRNELCMI